MQIKHSVTVFLISTTPKTQKARRVAKLLILLVLFVAIFWKVPLQDVIQVMLTADPVLLTIGIGLGFVSLFLSAVEIEPLTRNQGIRHGFGRILLINMAVKFYNQFLPTTLVGSGIRWYRLAQPGGKGAESLAALAFFRALETFLTLAIGMGFWLMSENRGMQVNALWLLALIALLILGWVLITRYSLPMYLWLKSHAAGMVEKPPIRPVLRYLEKFLGAVSAYTAIPAWDLLLAVTAGIASALTAIFSGTVLAKSIGLDIGFMDMGWIQAIILFATQLPFAVAGGLGIREVTLIAILGTFGVAADQALAFSFLLLIRGLILSLLGGVTEAIDIALSRRSMDSKEQPVESVHQETKE